MARKKKAVKKEEEKIPKSIRKKEEIYIKIAVIFMLALILSFIAGYFVIKSMNKFSYKGISFEKTKLGNSIFYIAKMPLKNALPLSVYFRENPKKLERIEGVKIILTEEVALAIEKEGMECPDSLVAGTTLSQYLMKAFNFKTYAATTNKTDAASKNIPYARCGPFDSNSIILFKKANETRIREDNNCYILEFANCEIMNVTEKFMMDVYRDLNA